MKYLILAISFTLYLFSQELDDFFNSNISSGNTTHSITTLDEKRKEESREDKIDDFFVNSSISLDRVSKVTDKSLRWQKIENVVIDTKLGLMWQDNSEVKNIKTNWEDAKLYCNKLTLLGHKDWYLPSYDELLSIVDYGRYKPAIKSSFSNVNITNYYWSSTESAIFSKFIVWIVNFGDGDTDSRLKTDERYIRCVRTDVDYSKIK